MGTGKSVYLIGPDVVSITLLDLDLPVLLVLGIEIVRYSSTIYRLGS